MRHGNSFGFDFDTDWLGLAIVILALGLVCSGRHMCDNSSAATCAKLADDCRNRCYYNDAACTRACTDSYSMCIQRISGGGAMGTEDGDLTSSPD